MASTLSDTEIGLIKTMLQAGWKNAAIQFYFNTPERPVNNGRISEIKGGGRGQGVPPATEYELEEFLDHHPLTLARLGEDEPETPQQVPSATHFIVNEDELLDVQYEVLSDDISGDPELNEVYQELRIAAHEFSGMGHNTLGEIAPKVDAFVEALPEDTNETNVSRIWMRGNKLRILLSAHDQVAEIPDMHPAKLDVACVAALRTVVQLFNVFTANSQRASELDQLKMGPDDRAALSEILPEIEQVIKDANTIATDQAIGTLEEEIESALTADDTAVGDRQVSFVSRSTSNFLTTAIVRAYRLIRKGIGASISAVWTKLKDKAAEAAAVAVLGAPSYGPPLVEFLKSNYGIISDFLTKVHANPAVQQFLDFVMKALGLA